MELLVIFILYLLHFKCLFFSMFIISIITSISIYMVHNGYVDAHGYNL